MAGRPAIIMIGRLYKPLVRRPLECACRKRRKRAKGALTRTYTSAGPAYSLEFCQPTPSIAIGHAPHFQLSVNHQLQDKTRTCTLPLFLWHAKRGYPAQARSRRPSAVDCQSARFVNYSGLAQMVSLRNFYANHDSNCKLVKLLLLLLLLFCCCRCCSCCCCWRCY